MSPTAEELIQAGHDITSIKYYAVGLATILFYDYFLTLQDEVRYAWKGRKSWVFVVYILNRYLPMAYTLWVLVSNYSWSYTYEVRVCNKTKFIEILFFVWCTLIAQIILNARMYAITRGNIIITGFFVCITITQFGVGIYLTTLAASAPAQRLPPIHLAAYQLCIFTRHRKVEIAHTAISLFYDSSAFMVIFGLAAKSGLMGRKMPRILRAIVQDATIYFLVIFTSHFVLEMTILLARPSLQLLPAIGNLVYLSIMIGRLMLSLKKAAEASTGWSVASIAHTSNLGGHPSKRSTGMEFAPMSEEGTVSSAEEDISLRVVSPPMP